MNLKKYSKPISYKTKSRVGILYLHGFTSTLSSIKYQCDKFYKKGFNVEAPSLAGHGTVWQDLNKISWNEWLLDSEKALLKLKKRADVIFIAGLSMGGAIALLFASYHSELAGIILVNHALFLKKDWRLPLLPLIINFKKFEDTKVGGDLKDKREFEQAYEKFL